MRVESTWHEIPFGGHDAVLVLTIDRTEQFRAEERNREQARLLDLAADAIIVRDLKHRVVFWNRGAERLYGWSPQDVIDRAVTDFCAKDVEAYLLAQVARLEHGEWNGQFKHIAKDGRQVMVNSRGTLVRNDDGKPESVLVIERGVSLVWFGADGSPETAYVSGLYAPQPRFRIPAAASRLARSARPQGTAVWYR